MHFGVWVDYRGNLQMYRNGAGGINEDIHNPAALQRLIKNIELPQGPDWYLEKCSAQWATIRGRDGKDYRVSLQKPALEKIRRIRNEPCPHCKRFRCSVIDSQ